MNAPGLSKTPRHLHDLWREWTDGLFNNKPASQLSPTERASKAKLCSIGPTGGPKP
jgi:hypothetical protein